MTGAKIAVSFRVTIYLAFEVKFCGIFVTFLPLLFFWGNWIERVWKFDTFGPQPHNDLGFTVCQKLSLSNKQNHNPSLFETLFRTKPWIALGTCLTYTNVRFFIEFYVIFFFAELQKLKLKSWKSVSPLCLSLSYFPSFLSDPANWRRQTNLFTGILENLTHILATKEITGIYLIFSEILFKIHRVWTESGVWLKHHSIFFFKGVADPSTLE